MSPRVRQILKWAGYVAFYVFSLLVFAYLTFPYNRLGDRIVQEFNSKQTGPKPMRLKLGDMSSYWLGGVEAQDITLTSAGDPDENGKPGKPKVLKIDSAHASISFLRLLFGTVRISFGADAFGGQLSGYTSTSDEGRNLEVELEDLDLGQAPLFADIVGLPLSGKLSGTVDLLMPEEKLAKADGKINLKVSGLAAGDGKAKIRNAIALPRLDAGDLTLDAEAKTGNLKITNFSANGPDLKLESEGALRLRDPFDSSLLSLAISFKFQERYTNKSDLTKSLFGGGSMPGLFDLDPQMKHAKRADGSYGWRATGALARLNFTPSPVALGGGGGTKGAAPPTVE
ncbi:MAG TPA: type II secretion system protein GspN [Polyangiaceae bacterium]|nr:type II secretion system protein GspN [Polyangiaceae bacterium]